MPVIPTIRSLLVRARNLFRRQRFNREFDAELAEHLSLHIADNLRFGMSPAEARRNALLKLGGVDQTIEDYRRAAGFPFLESILQDLRFALRSLCHSRGITLTAMLTLGLGIGATAVMFSIIYQVFFNAFPYKNSDRYVVFGIQNVKNTGGWKDRGFYSTEEIRSFRENHVFEDMIVHNGRFVAYDNGKTIHRWPRGEEVSTNTFEFLGVAPLLGRTFSESDATSGSPPVFVMSYRLWQSDFSGNPNILNTVFVLDGKPWTLVGVMPQRFTFSKASFWMPMSNAAPTGSIVGRRKPGLSMLAVAADLDAIAHQAQSTEVSGWFPGEFRIIPHTLLDSVIGGFRKTLYSLLAAVLLLLLIACSNVANLLLAHATAREREITIRAALGASRVRLVRQLLAESLLVASLACAMGCLLAYFALRLVIVLIPPGALPEEVVLRMNGPVLIAAMCLALLTAVLCGLAPALHIIRVNRQPQLTGRATNRAGNTSHGVLRAALVTGEVAVSIVLLVGAGLLMRSFFILTQVDFGFDPQKVVHFRLALPKPYNTDVDTSRQRRNALTREVLDRLQAIPGVTAASESMLEPPLSYDWSDTIIPGKPHTERWETRFEVCSEGYFEVLGLPLLQGRLFSRQDIDAQRLVMVVNEMFVHQYFPGENPIGRHVKLQVLDRPFLDAPHDTYFEVIGIVGDQTMRDDQSRSWRPFPETYVPYSVQGFSYRTYMARTALDPQDLLQTIDQAVRKIDPDVEIASSGTIDANLREFYRRPRFVLFTVAVFAAIGVALVFVGIFALVAYNVSRQTHDIGVRIAIGAPPLGILEMVLSSSLRLIFTGAAIGLLSSYGASRFMISEISGVSVSDHWTYAAVAVFVIAVGLVASYIPARRATRVDPIAAIRYE